MGDGWAGGLKCCCFTIFRDVHKAVVKGSDKLSNIPGMCLGVG